jgi:hypothetical protein
LVGNNTHVGRDGVDKDSLLDVAQQLAAGAHLRLGLSNGTRRVEAIEQRLHERHAGDPRLQVRGLSGSIRQSVCDCLISGAEVAVYLRAITRHGLRNCLVRGPQPRALNIDQRIGLIDSRQGIDQCFRYA